MDYEKKANEFAQKYGVKLQVLGSEYRKYFDTDKDRRTVFKMRISRGRESYTFTFGQSISAGSKHPTMYDALACFTKWDPGSYEDFCMEYGADISRKTYNAVVREFEAVERLFGDVMEELGEIG